MAKRLDCAVRIFNQDVRKLYGTQAFSASFAYAARDTLGVVGGVGVPTYVISPHGWQ